MRLRTQWRDRDAAAAKGLARAISREERDSVKPRDQVPAKRNDLIAEEEQDAAKVGDQAAAAECNDELDIDDELDVAGEEDLIDLGPSRESSPQNDDSEDLIDFDDN
jgi:hypothetical protein